MFHVVETVDKEYVKRKGKQRSSMYVFLLIFSGLNIAKCEFPANPWA